MKASHFSKDTQEFLELLDKHKVKYVIVGGEAVIYYGCARLTGDVDFFFGTSKENAQGLYNTLEEFWGGDIPGVNSVEELMESGTILQFGVPPNRIDLINRIDGVTFEESWAGKTTTNVEISGKSIPVYFIGLAQLIANKESIGRPKDLEDLKYLKKAKEDRPL
jgi:predicted nucleotidyltransferase